MQALGFSKHPFSYLIIIIILVVGGLWIHSDFKLIPLIGLVVGILLGLYTIRGPKKGTI
jgi:hypothetical protein